MKLEIQKMTRYLTLVLVVLSFTKCKKEVIDAPISVRPVKYVNAKLSNLSEKHTFSGTSESKNEANLSFKVAGTLNKIHVKVGDLISKGQLMASLEPTDYQISLRQAEAKEQGSEANEESSATQIKSARANYIASKSAYERITSLYENNSISLSEFEQAKANFEAADAQYSAAKAQYEAAKFNSAASLGQKISAQNQVAYTKLMAPFSGVITVVHKEENELVNSGTNIVTLNSIGDPEVVVGVPEVMISNVTKGMRVKVSFSSIPNKTFNSNVVEVGFSPGSGATYPVTIELLESDNRIRPGMPANVEFAFKTSEVENQKLLVPTASVGEDSKGRFVFLLIKDETGKLAITKKTYIEIGKLRNQGFEILKGLGDGDLIAAAGLNILQDGDKVRLD